LLVDATSRRATIYSMKNIKEEWKKIPDYSGYEASNLGRVRNCKTNRIFNPTAKYKDQYLVINVLKNEKRKTITIHRLIALAFLPRIKGKNIVNHKNKNRHDNRATNLEWVTCKESTHHAFDKNFLREYRKKNNLTQYDISALAEVDVRTVQRWESQETTIPNNIIKLLEIYEPNLSKLLVDTTC
jgi:DNA-binding transcriptional regulator YiaG